MFDYRSSQSNVESSWIEVSPFIILEVKEASNPIRSIKFIIDSQFCCSFLILKVTKLCPVTGWLTFYMKPFLKLSLNSA